MAPLERARSVEPFSARGVRPSEAEAYFATASLRSLRRARFVGRKICFTNRNIRPLYNIAQPIWGDVTEDRPAGWRPYLVIHMCRTKVGV